MAGDVVHSLNGTPVVAEAAATLLASEAGERLTLRLQPPPGASTVHFAKADAAQQVGLDLRYDEASGRVRVAGIAADSPAKENQLGGGLKVGLNADSRRGLDAGEGLGLRAGDVLLAIDGVRAVDVQTAAEVLRVATGRVEVRVLRSCGGYGGYNGGYSGYGGDCDLEVVEISKLDSGAGLVLLTAATGHCMVGRVVPGSPAARGRNVWLGDLIESVNERAVPIGPGSAEAARLLIDASGDVMTLGIRRPVEGDELEKVAVLARPTAGIKLGLTLTDLGRGQVVIHQVYDGYKAACLQAGDFVVSVNGEPVDTEPQATQIASSSTGDLKLALRSPVGARSVWMKKENECSPLGIAFEEHDGVVLIKKLLPGFPAAGDVVPAVGDVLLAVNGVRAADVTLAMEVLQASVGLVDLRIIHHGPLPVLARPLQRGNTVTLSTGTLQVSGDI